MQKLEEKFFDEYKRLDSLCRDLLAAERGVSDYIAEMEARTSAGSRLVPGWRDDYYTLKHLRWMRNQIAHESGATDCGAGELEQVRRFHARILKQQDPLALLRRANAAKKPPTAAPSRAAAPAAKRPAPPTARRFRTGSAARPGRAKRAPLRVYLCAAVIALLLVLLAVYLYSFGQTAV